MYRRTKLCKTDKVIFLEKAAEIEMSNAMDDYERYPQHMRGSEARQQLWNNATAEGVFGLTTEEKRWRDRRPFLESKGYMLRKRYQVGWTPSWIGTDISPWRMEDSKTLMVRFLE